MQGPHWEHSVRWGRGSRLRAVGGPAYLSGEIALLRCPLSMRTLDLTLSRIKSTERVPCGSEQQGDEDQHAELLRPGGQHDTDEVDEVHEVVQGALHAVHSSSLRFWNVLLKKLSHREVEGPETYRAAVLGENECGRGENPGSCS